MGNPQHVSLWSDSPALPMLESRPGSKHTLLFVAGLSDTLATVPYLISLADAIAPLDFNLVQPQLSSSLGGYGLSSLEADAQEMCLVIKHLDNRSQDARPRDGKVVIMGHSTGCQDVVHLLSQAREGVQIDGAILQAPVSDRECFEEDNSEGDPDQVRLRHATSLVEQGKGSTLLDRQIDPPRLPSKEAKVNGAAFQEPAITAYRFWSLYAVGGDDDFFSSDLSLSKMTQIWRTTLSRGNRVLALLSEQDESYPSHVSPKRLAAQWKEVVDGGCAESADRFDAFVVSGADHKVEDNKAQAELIQKVVKMLEEVVRGEEAEPASFDEVVELISTGKADSIPGVKTIPLKINEATPSASHMQRPAKPWEREEGGKQ